MNLHTIEPVRLAKAGSQNVFVRLFMIVLLDRTLTTRELVRIPVRNHITLFGRLVGNEGNGHELGTERPDRIMPLINLMIVTMGYSSG
jgi:hypothetical protein